MNINTLPELLPNDAIPGTINAIIINGITNDKKLENNELKVANILIGNKMLVCLQTNPNTIPNIRNKKIRLINEKFFNFKFPPL
ncbi:hypothetical protein UT300005_28270 [Clostridium sp. CTA-5]